MTPISGAAGEFAPRWPVSVKDWLQFIAGLALSFALFDWVARRLGSDRGQAGLLVGAVVVMAVLAIERWLTGESPGRSLRELGFGIPAWSGLTRALVVCLLLLLVVAVYLSVTRAPFSMYPGWVRLLPGLFAQAGIAEETLFRGYLFRHVRRGRSFWKAALVSSGPFVLVHLLMFATMPWPIAFVSVLLAAFIAFPLAYVFESGGNTIWPPALVHWVVQGVVKIVTIDETAPHFALVWIAASAIVPFVAFVGRREPELSADRA